MAQLVGYQAINPEPLEFTFQDDDDKVHKLSDFKGKVVLVNLWAPNCGPCVQELPSIHNLMHIFKPNELVILPICTHTQFKEPARSLFHIGNLDGLTLYFDHEASLAKSVKSRGIPVTLIVDQGGNLVGRLDGATAWDHYENVQLLNDMIKGKTKPLTFGQKIKAFFQKLLG